MMDVKGRCVSRSESHKRPLTICKMAWGYYDPHAIINQ